ncbi:ubiquinol oxidase subunit II [Rickettsiales bacterium LUAb2]
MRKLKIIFTSAIFVLMFFLSGCSKLIVLNPAGDILKQENVLLYITVALILIVVLPVLVLSVVIPIRYRASNKKAKYDPSLTHGTKIEILWWGIPCIIILILSIITWESSHRLDPYRPLDSKVKPVTIQAIALDWKWLFIYPEQKIATVNYIAFPVDTPVNFVITSDGSMNSLIIHRLGGQIYAMTGMKTKLHLIARKAGEYDGRSMNYSGEGFSNMTFIANAVSNDDFQKWVNKVHGSGKTLTANAYANLVLPSENVKATFFSSVESGLFDKVVNKYLDMASMHMDHKNNMKSHDDNIKNGKHLDMQAQNKQ